MKDFLKRICGLYKPFRKQFGIIFLFIAITQALELVTPYVAGKTFDALGKKGPSFVPIQMLIVLGFVLGIIRKFSGHRKDKYEVLNLDFRLTEYFSKKALEKLLSMSVGQHLAQNSGLVRSIVTRGQQALVSFATTMLYQAIPMSEEAIFAMIALTIVNPFLGSVVIGGGVAYVTIGLYLNKRFAKRLQKLDWQGNKDDELYDELLKNITVIQLNGQEERILKEYTAQIGQTARAQEEIWSAYSNIAFWRGMVAPIVTFFVLSIGGWHVFHEHGSIGTFFIFMMWTATALSKLNQFAPLHRQCAQMIIAIKKYFAVLKIVPDVKTIANPIRKQVEGKLEFRNVFFEYPDLALSQRILDEEDEAGYMPSEDERGHALRGISFTIESGERVAFVGESGAGKSTITHLLLRAYDPTEGQVLVDGSDVRLLDLVEWRCAIGFVEQEVRLLDLTLKENILFGLNGEAKNFPLEEFEVILRTTRLDQLRLGKRGFDTKVGERGVRLSGGERQRVGIARALAKNPKVLIFDEATSSLDAKNERLIKQTVDQASVGRTTIIIAHRLSTVRNADRIFVLDKGQIVGVGKHEELLETCPTYAELVREQMFPI